MSLPPGGQEFVEFLERNDEALRRAARGHALSRSWADPAVCGDDVYARAVERGFAKWADLDPGWDDDRRRAWLITIMLKVSQEDYRRGARARNGQLRLQHDHDIVVQECAARADPTCSAVEMRELLDRLLPAALATLTEGNRRAWVMTRSRAASSTAIAAELDITESSLRSRVARARAQLLQALGSDLYALLDPPHAGGASA